MTTGGLLRGFNIQEKLEKKIEKADQGDAIEELEEKCGKLTKELQELRNTEDKHMRIEQKENKSSVNLPSKINLVIE